MTSDFKTQAKNFFSALLSFCVLLLVSSGTFIGGYALGLHRIQVPYLSDCIKAPDEKPAGASVASSASASAPGMGLSLPTSASALNLDYSAYVKSSTALTPAMIKDKFILLKFLPYAEQTFGFTAILPKGWKAVPPQLHLDPGGLMENLGKHRDTQVELAQVDAPGTSEALYQARALYVPAEASLDRFYEKYAEGINAKIMVDQPESGGRKNVLLKYNTHDGKPMLARSVAVRNGNYVMYLNCCALEKDFPSFAEAYNMSALSFTPDTVTGLAPFDVSVDEAAGAAATIK